eukprot:CAMPEP_0119491124 /NCGR_PEP_ID=MMETSP1344-20130328/16103_1 /TAXON_ID=236787 /ORGANISM="Florenciella parvula, Strain CCMP2471" /LENGTH=99 /DNA_ID=CAMNT_0007526355 /DNA_START=310 /DNA_END=605 /DNA_ORIENTATION=-
MANQADDVEADLLSQFIQAPAPEPRNWQDHAFSTLDQPTLTQPADHLLPLPPAAASRWSPSVPAQDLQMSAGRGDRWSSLDRGFDGGGGGGGGGGHGGG